MTPFFAFPSEVNLQIVAAKKDVTSLLGHTNSRFFFKNNLSLVDSTL
jgi:hypothetical protein